MMTACALLFIQMVRITIEYMTLQKGKSHGHYEAQNNDWVSPCEYEADEGNGTLGTPTREGL